MDTLQLETNRPRLPAVFDDMRQYISYFEGKISHSNDRAGFAEGHPERPTAAYTPPPSNPSPTQCLGTFQPDNNGDLASADGFRRLERPTATNTRPSSTLSPPSGRVHLNLTTKEMTSLLISPVVLKSPQQSTHHPLPTIGSRNSVTTLD